MLVAWNYEASRLAWTWKYSKNVKKYILCEKCFIEDPQMLKMYRPRVKWGQIKWLNVHFEPYTISNEWSFGVLDQHYLSKQFWFSGFSIRSIKSLIFIWLKQYICTHNFLYSQASVNVIQLPMSKTRFEMVFLDFYCKKYTLGLNSVIRHFRRFFRFFT